MNTRDRILNEAESLFRAGGHAGLSLRKIAAAAGIRAPSVYVHFASKEAIVAALRQRAMAGLMARFEAVEKREVDALAQLVAAGLAYVRFSTEERETFTLFFSSFISERKNLEQAEVAASPYTFLRKRVVDLAAPVWGQDSPHRFDEITYGYWALIHGAALLQATFLEGFTADFEAADRANFKRFLRGCLQR